MVKSSSATDTRKPYSGAHRSLVVALDVGTTFSGVSYAFLEPGQVPNILGVTRFPGQEHVAGNSKIPSVLFYDRHGTMMRAGAEADSSAVVSLAEDEGWTKVELFKLRLRPRTMKLQMNGMRLSSLPRQKSASDVFGDFLGYLFSCTRSFVTDTYPNGSALWAAVEPHIQFVLSHPNGWEGAQQTKMRRAAVYGGLIPDTDEGRSRIRFVTEGEASLHACVLNGLAADVLSNPSSHGFVVADAGGGTLDISSYAIRATAPLVIEEIAPPDCVFAGSVFVSRRARAFLEEKLKSSKYNTPDAIDHITKRFDETTKRLFRSRKEAQFIPFGSPLDKDVAVGIRNGQLKLSGDEVADLFEPSIEAAVASIKAQVDASGGMIKSVWLVGGFAASPWLFGQLQERLGQFNVTVSRPDTQTSKAVANGAVGFYCDHHVSARMSKFMYGVEYLREYDGNDEEHVARKERLCELPSGPTLLPDAFDCILSRSVRVKESTVFTRKYCTELTSLSMLSVFEVEIWCFRGGDAIPKWILRHSDDFSTLCVVRADLSPLASSAQPKKGRNATTYYTIIFSIEIHFGLTEFRARLKWNDNGTTRYGPASIIYNESGHRADEILADEELYEHDVLTALSYSDRPRSAQPSAQPSRTHSRDDKSQPAGSRGLPPGAGDGPALLEVPGAERARSRGASPAQPASPTIAGARDAKDKGKERARGSARRTPGEDELPSDATSGSSQSKGRLAETLSAVWGALAPGSAPVSPASPLPPSASPQPEIRTKEIDFGAYAAAPSAQGAKTPRSAIPPAAEPQPEVRSKEIDLGAYAAAPPASAGAKTPRSAVPPKSPVVEEQPQPPPRASASASRSSKTPVEPKSPMEPAAKTSGSRTPADAAPKTPVEAAPKTPVEVTSKSLFESSARTPGSKTPGAKTPGAKTPASKTPVSKTSKTPAEPAPTTPVEPAAKTPGSRTPVESAPKTPVDAAPKTPLEPAGSSWDNPSESMWNKPSGSPWDKPTTPIEPAAPPPAEPEPVPAEFSAAPLETPTEPLATSIEPPAASIEPPAEATEPPAEATEPEPVVEQPTSKKGKKGKANKTPVKTPAKTPSKTPAKTPARSPDTHARDLPAENTEVVPPAEVSAPAPGGDAAGSLDAWLPSAAAEGAAEQKEDVPAPAPAGLDIPSHSPLLDLNAHTSPVVPEASSPGVGADATAAAPIGNSDPLDDLYSDPAHNAETTNAPYGDPLSSNAAEPGVQSKGLDFGYSFGSGDFASSFGLGAAAPPALAPEASGNTQNTSSTSTFGNWGGSGALGSWGISAPKRMSSTFSAGFGLFGGSSALNGSGDSAPTPSFLDTIANNSSNEQPAGMERSASQDAIVHGGTADSIFNSANDGNGGNDMMSELLNPPSARSPAAQATELPPVTEETDPLVGAGEEATFDNVNFDDVGLNDQPDEAAAADIAGGGDTGEAPATAGGEDDERDDEKETKGKGKKGKKGKNAKDDKKATAKDDKKDDKKLNKKQQKEKEEEERREREAQERKEKAEKDKQLGTDGDAPPLSKAAAKAAKKNSKGKKGQKMALGSFNDEPDGAKEGGEGTPTGENGGGWGSNNNDEWS